MSRPRADFRNLLLTKLSFIATLDTMRFLINKIFGNKHERDLKKLLPLVERINALEREYQKLSDEELRNKTAEFKTRIVAGASLDSILCEAFAAVKNACRRLVGTKITACIFYGCKCFA